jgi:molecular chaperone GrpE (heat shock protein)
MKVTLLKRMAITTIVLAMSISSIAQERGDVAIGANVLTGSYANKVISVGIGAKLLYNVTAPIRLAAEFDNYRKRTSRERLDLIKTAGEDLIQGLLPVLDDFNMALGTIAEASDLHAVCEGVDLIYRKLFKYLESKGMQTIEATGLPFDTDLHEAVTQSPVEDPNLKGKIIEILQQGYTLNGKVIRYAKVVVGI